MTGGLIQLVAYGIQDLFLTKDPQITFFKIVYRRHTNFSTEVIPQFFTHTPDFGKRVTCILSKNGDLVSQMHLVVVLPDVPQFKDINGNLDAITKFAWVRRIGYAIIKTVEIEIDGELIDRQYGDWLNIWHDLTLPASKNIDKMLGDIKELVEFTNGKKSYQLFIPLQFWFNKVPGLALPIVALQYNHLKINVELNDLTNCYNIVPTHYIAINNDFVNYKPFEFITQDTDGVVSLARFIYFDIVNRYLYLWRYTDNGFLSGEGSKYDIVGLDTGFIGTPQEGVTEHIAGSTVNFNSNLALSLKQAYLLVEYVFLDDDERLRFSQAKHTYLIEQVMYAGENTITGINQSFKIGFNSPCKELLWVTQLTGSLNTRINQTFNYTDSLIEGGDGTGGGTYEGGNIILLESILFNGQERVSSRDSMYFTNVQVYQHHKVGRLDTRPPINTYSFSLHPEEMQPSCTANLSKIDNILLKVSVNPTINYQRTAKLRIYGLMYNVLKIVNGISGLVFANE